MLRAKAEPAKDKRTRMVSPENLAALGLDLMHRADTNVHATAVTRAKMHRNGLMTSLLARRPVRGGNFGTIAISKHLQKAGCGSRVLKFREGFPPWLRGQDLNL